LVELRNDDGHLVGWIPLAEAAAAALLGLTGGGAMSAPALDPRAVARALGGEASGNRVTAPGPGHSPRDRSLSILLDPAAPGGLLVTSHAGDDPLVAKDYIKAKLGLGNLVRSVRTHRDADKRTRFVASDNGDAARTARALALWDETRPPAGTPVQAYLARRGVGLADGAEEAIRFHGFCPFAGKRTPAMVALVRDILTDVPKAVHRTAITVSGEKVRVADKDRLALGPIAGGAVKITPDADVTLCLGIGEGIESTLSLRELPEFGASPVWSLLSAGGLTAFPCSAASSAYGWPSIAIRPASVPPTPAQIAGARPGARCSSSVPRPNAPTSTTSTP
jgi:hypothetical protein